MAFRHYLYSRVPGPITVLALPTTLITSLEKPAPGLHSTVYPLRFNTIPCPSTVKADLVPNAPQGQPRISFWRVKTPPDVILSV